MAAHVATAATTISPARVIAGSIITAGLMLFMPVVIGIAMCVDAARGLVLARMFIGRGRMPGAPGVHRREHAGRRECKLPMQDSQQKHASAHVDEELLHFDCH